MQLDAASLERLVPDELQPGDVTGEEALRISLERYGFAARYARSCLLYTSPSPRDS